MTAIHEGLQLHIGGEKAAARAKFAKLWDKIAATGDPLHRCALAHYMADVCVDPRDELEWDLRALAAADSLTDERAKEYHDSLAVKGFYPSLHLNLGEDYRKLGDLGEARRHLGLGRERLASLGDDEYGVGIREALTALAARIEEHPDA